MIESETLSDSYVIAQDLRLTKLQCGPRDLEFGDLYTTYLIDPKGSFTKDKLKAYQSLQGSMWKRSHSILLAYEQIEMIGFPESLC